MYSVFLFALCCSFLLSVVRYLFILLLTDCFSYSLFIYVFYLCMYIVVDFVRYFVSSSVMYFVIYVWIVLFRY